MRQRRMAPPRPAPICVKGPDDDRSRTIERLEREIRRLNSANKSMQDMIDASQKMERKLDDELRRGKKLVWSSAWCGRVLID